MYVSICLCLCVYICAYVFVCLIQTCSWYQSILSPLKSNSYCMFPSVSLSVYICACVSICQSVCLCVWYRPVVDTSPFLVLWSQTVHSLPLQHIIIIIIITIIIITSREGFHSISKMKSEDFPWLCSALFLDPSEVQLLVLCNFSRLLLPYTDRLLSPFCYNMQKMCIFTFSTINNSHATQTIHIIFAWPSTNFPRPN